MDLHVLFVVTAHLPPDDPTGECVESKRDIDYEDDVKQAQLTLAKQYWSALWAWS
jgi:hypothetical protein